VSPLDLILKPYHAAQNMVFEGGLFVFFIFATGVVLWTIVLERYWFFARILPGLTRDTMERWKSRREHRSWCSRQIRTAMISRLNAQMTSNLLLLKVLVPLSPLLGLIGTVSGMLEVFDSMALRGSADARTMASGVSHAMICTLTGLAVSITGLYPAYYFQARARRETELLADHLTF
jgi:biopolymer transport protein ExbB